MNLISKLILLLTLASYTQARELIVITYESESDAVRIIKESMISKDLSNEYYEFVQKSNPCEELYPDAILHLCIKGEYDMDVITVKKEILEKMMDDITK
jgi:hypothetical protein